MYLYVGIMYAEKLELIFIKIPRIKNEKCTRGQNLKEARRSVSAIHTLLRLEG